MKINMQQINQQLAKKQQLLTAIVSIIQKYNFPNLNKFGDLSQLIQLNLCDAEINLTQLECLIEASNVLQKIILKNCPQLVQCFHNSSNHFKKLKELELQEVLIKNLQTIQFQNLERLKIQNCKSLITIVVSNCKNLEKLSVLYCQITQIKIENLQKLTFLRLLDCYQLAKVQSKNCLNIQKIIITSSKINQTILANLLEGLAQINQLNLSYSKMINTLNIDHLQKLIDLNLQRTGLTHLHIQGLNQLQLLNLFSMNNLTQLKIKNCNKLSSIQIGNNTMNNEITYVELQQMDKLERIQFNSNNQINYLKLTNLKNIKKINLSKIFIKTVQMSNLQSLTNVDGYQGRRVHGISMSQCKQLQRIDIQHGIIRKIVLRQLHNLTQIKLKYCKQLKQIKIDFCQKLKQLDLSGSSQSLALKYILTNNLNNLQKLKLESNKIESIQPLAIIDFSNLNLIDLSKNFISLTKSLNKTRRLTKSLILFDNPISNLDFCRGLSKITQLHLPYEAKDMDCACILKLESDDLGRYILGICTDRRIKFKNMLIQRFIDL